MLDEDFLLSSYDYHLPKELIANYPIYPKENAKLLIYIKDKDQIIHSTFKNLIEFLPKCAIFFNDTKVIKARIYGKKQSGGKIEILFHHPLEDNKFLIQIKGKVKEGDVLEFDDNLKAKIIKIHNEGLREVYFYKDEFALKENEIFDIFDKIGHVPLPPYIKREDNKDDLKDYQSIFAKYEGAIAAPTASLHFSDEMIKKLQKKHDIYKITLHVGAGTFKSVECDNIKDHKMHYEFFNINNEEAKIINSNEPILAIGTTTTRTIEYFYRTKIQNGKCDLFLHPNNKPKRVNYLLTNFHLPKSTLIMLVSSFIGREKTLNLYNEAIKNNYRFYSYGDAMLII